MQEKICIKCKIKKTIEEFPLRKEYENGNGRRSICKICNALYHSQYHIHYYEKNREKWKENVREWQRKNPSKVNSYKRNWEQKNPDKVYAYKVKANELNRDKWAVLAAIWRRNNPEKARESYKRSGRKRLGTAQGKLRSNITRSINHSLHGNKHNRHWEDIVGFTLKELQQHLEDRFIDGMSWERYMNGEIHVDHITPVSVFHFNSPEDEDFKKCWNLHNLQPLWAKENLKKYNHIT